jgi:hypothetical protein
MLGLLRMSVDEAIEALLVVAFSVFPEVSQQPSDRETNSRNLKESIESLLQARKIPLDTKLHDRNRLSTRCKVYVSTSYWLFHLLSFFSVLYATTATNIAHPHIFRTYLARGSSINPTIVEALCATISSPSHFSPVKIGPRLRQRTFVGGPLGTNNPTRELLKEASAVFGKDTHVAQIISIGCGTPHIPSIDDTMNERPVERLSAEMAAECHIIAHEISSRLGSVDAYRRFSVEMGVEYTEIDDWSVLRDIEIHTACYIEEAERTMSLDASLQQLRSQIGTVTLAELSMCPMSI